MEGGLGGGAFPLEPSVYLPPEINDILLKARTTWLKNHEVLELLQGWHEFQLGISPEAPQLPSGGTLYLFNKNECRFFRKDGVSWKKKPDGKTVRETHEKLKVGNVKCLNCYYAHADQDGGLQRRCYWMLDEAHQHIVLVHYLNCVSTRAGIGGGGGNGIGSSEVQARARWRRGGAAARPAAERWSGGQMQPAFAFLQQQQQQQQPQGYYDASSTDLDPREVFTSDGSGSLTTPSTGVPSPPTADMPALPSGLPPLPLPEQYALSSLQRQYVSGAAAVQEEQQQLLLQELQGQQFVLQQPQQRQQQQQQDQAHCSSLPQLQRQAAVQPQYREVQPRYRVVQPRYQQQQQQQRYEEQRQREYERFPAPQGQDSAAYAFLQQLTDWFQQQQQGMEEEHRSGQAVEAAVEEMASWGIDVPVEPADEVPAMPVGPHQVLGQRSLVPQLSLQLSQLFRENSFGREFLQEVAGQPGGAEGADAAHTGAPGALAPEASDVSRLLQQLLEASGSGGETGVAGGAPAPPNAGGSLLSSRSWLEGLEGVLNVLGPMQSLALLPDFPDLPGLDLPDAAGKARLQAADVEGQKQRQESLKNDVLRTLYRLVSTATTGAAARRDGSGGSSGRGGSGNASPAPPAREQQAPFRVPTVLPRQLRMQQRQRELEEQQRRQREAEEQQRREAGAGAGVQAAQRAHQAGEQEEARLMEAEGEAAAGEGVGEPAAGVGNDVAQREAQAKERGGSGLQVGESMELSLDWALVVGHQQELAAQEESSQARGQAEAQHTHGAGGVRRRVLEKQESAIQAPPQRLRATRSGKFHTVRGQ